MEHIFLFAIFTTILFVFFKLIEMKYLEQEFKPLKVMFRDSFVVFLSSFLASYGYYYTQHSFSDFLNIVTENKTLKAETTQIYTDIPGF